MIALMIAVLALGGGETDTLIRRLGSDRYEEREVATLSLIKKGRAVRARVARALEETTDLEVAVRLRRILWQCGRLVEADALLLVMTERFAKQTEMKLPKKNRWKDAAVSYPVNRIVRLRTGRYACFIAAKVTYIRSDPKAAWIPYLKADIDRPFEIDPPAAFDILTRVHGFAALIPALRERAKKTSDPIVKRACQRAIHFQEKGHE